MRAQNVQVSWLSAVVFVVRSTAAWKQMSLFLWSRFCVCGPLKELKLVISCKLQSKADIFDCFFFGAHYAARIRDADDGENKF